jgi:hypothetical protein
VLCSGRREEAAAKAKAQESGMNRPEHITEIIQRWTDRQAEWSKLGANVNGAALAAEVVADLEKIAASNGDAELTLTDASTLSGYSTDHLSRLIREGKLENRGRKGAPRIRRADLPLRPKGGIATARNNGYNPDTDARSLGVRR